MRKLTFDTNLLDPMLFPDLGGPPHELFDMWRNDDPVHFNPPSDTYECPMPGGSVQRGFYVLTKHKDVFDASRNQQIFSSHEGGPVVWDLEPDQLAMQQANLMGAEPNRHAQIKRLVLPAFGPKELEAFYPEIDRVAKQIVDDIAPNGGCEFVFDVASKLPVYTFCKLMGIPDEMHDTVFELGNQAADTENPDRSDVENSATLKLFGIAMQLAEQKRANPDDSMFSRLIHGEVDGEKLDELTTNMFFVTLSIAGHETTRGTAVHFLRLMQEHPDQFELLMSDLDKYLPNAIEEVLRYSPPVIKFRRTVMEDTELGGQSLKKGDKIYLSYPAANRDPEVFEHPHVFDITRPNANKHLSFGTGPHVCLGARLARYQLQALLKELFTRLPDIRLAGEKRMMPSIWFNAIINMPVEFTAEA